MLSWWQFSVRFRTEYGIWFGSKSRKENCHRDHIPLNLKRTKKLFRSECKDVKRAFTRFIRAYKMLQFPLLPFHKETQQFSESTIVIFTHQLRRKWSRVNPTILEIFCDAFKCHRDISKKATLNISESSTRDSGCRPPKKKAPRSECARDTDR